MSGRIAVRMDDITPDMNWENFSFFVELFEKTGITPLLGIVPDNRDSSLSCGPADDRFAQTMRELRERGYVIAMHGCHHLYTTKKGGMFPLNHASEFAGVPYERQKEMLLYGRQKMREAGLDTDLFMAPSHSYDRNTLKALRETGFTKLTDGFGRRPYLWAGMTFYPISFMLNRSLKQKNGATTMVIHANHMTDADRQSYADLFREYGDRMISYSEYLQTPPAKRGRVQRGAEYLLAVCKYILVRARKRYKRG